MDLAQPGILAAVPVVGVGPSLVAALGASVPGLHVFPAISGAGVEVPSTRIVLWCPLVAHGCLDLRQLGL